MYSRDPKFLFTLRYRFGTGLATIHAWEGPFEAPNHTRIDCALVWRNAEGKTKHLFPRGATWCAIPGHETIDGIAAKELVTSVFAMKPGDTDADYFASYTQEQLDWAERFGEELDMLKSDRYCDPETGEVRA